MADRMTPPRTGGGLEKKLQLFVMLGCAVFQAGKAITWTFGASINRFSAVLSAAFAAAGFCFLAWHQR